MSDQMSLPFGDDPPHPTEGQEELPAGWSNTSISSIAEINPAHPASIPTEDSTVTFIPMSAMTAITGEIDVSQLRIWREVKKGYTRFQEEDVLFAKITPCMENGKVAVARHLHGRVGAGSTEFHVLRPTSAISADFLRFFILQENFRKAARSQMTGAVGQLRVPASFLDEHQIPLPPLPEQHRIVEAIESYFTRLDDAVASLERVKRNLKRYRASVLQAAVEGRLVPTEAELARAEGRSYEPASVLLERILEERRRRWKESGGRGKYQEPQTPDTSNLPDLPEGWCWATFDTLSELRLGKMLDKAKNRGNPLTYLRNINVRWFTFDLSDLSEMRVEEDEFPDVSVRSGDLVVCEGGEPGRCAVWIVADKPMAIQKALHRVRPFIGVSPWFLAYSLAAGAASKRLARFFTGTTIHHLTGESLRAYPVPLPPVTEQERIVSAVGDVLYETGVVERSISANLQRCSRLRQSILKWAFEGKLADQDPNDEPASVLLERIRAERAAAGDVINTAGRGRSRKRGRA